MILALCQLVSTVLMRWLNMFDTKKGTQNGWAFFFYRELSYFLIWVLLNNPYLPRRLQRYWVNQSEIASTTKLLSYLHHANISVLEKIVKFRLVILDNSLAAELQLHKNRVSLRDLFALVICACQWRKRAHFLKARATLLRWFYARCRKNDAI